ncbi:MAG: hypothetical protein Q7J98_01590 [Kiritimatiellia bacterium]|nr:hypothetical protein [Kiritimatiellia bacterium]
MKPEIHILKTSVGIVVEGTFTEDAQWTCQWSPKPPFPPAVRAQIVTEYLLWRDSIFAGYAVRTGKRILMVTF